MSLKTMFEQNKQDIKCGIHIVKQMRVKMKIATQKEIIECIQAAKELDDLIIKMVVDDEKWKSIMTQSEFHQIIDLCPELDKLIEYLTRKSFVAEVTNHMT